MKNLEKEYAKEYATIQASGQNKKKQVQTNVAFAKLRADVKTQLSKDISAKRDAVNQFIASSSSSPALMVLNDLSVGIPKNVKIDVTQFTYTANPAAAGGKLVIKGETDGYSSVEAIKEAIKKIPTIGDLEEKQSGGKPGTDNKIIEFTFNAVYKPANLPGQSQTKG